MSASISASPPQKFPPSQPPAVAAHGYVLATREDVLAHLPYAVRKRTPWDPEPLSKMKNQPSHRSNYRARNWARESTYRYLADFQSNSK